MDFNKLYDMQEVLDQRINQEKVLSNFELLPEKLLALTVELGECANEWRGFKFWSDNRKANRGGVVKCDACKGTGSESHVTTANGKVFSTSIHKCRKCKGEKTMTKENSLLVEYVDCLHFLLSIGLELKARGVHLEPVKRKNVIQQFAALYVDVARLTISVEENERDIYLLDDFQDVANDFLGLGEMLSFGEKEIETAYFEKNAVNHERQNNGY